MYCKCFWERMKSYRREDYNGNFLVREPSGMSTYTLPASRKSSKQHTPKVAFSAIGGLDDHIRCLKEMILFPLLYKEIFEKFHIKPARGVLFYGPPGTGKTLTAAALANECSIGDRKVTFFNRKGADCLTKWVGDSEKKLRTLFEKAHLNRPSIIFFDELDGLAPTRSARQDQVHASIVSTLLALMDGLDAHSDVIVIGATNRLDAIDPALRRPGRFDRELYFPLPAQRARREILEVHMSHWSSRPCEAFMEELASQTVGYCGSDLQSLCSRAFVHAFKRQYPSIHNCKNKLRVNQRALKVEACDFRAVLPLFRPSSLRTLSTAVRRLSTTIKPLLESSLTNVMTELEEKFPFKFLFPERNLPCLSDVLYCPRMLLVGTAEQAHTLHLAPAILHQLEHLPSHVLDINALFDCSNIGDYSCPQTCIRYKIRGAILNQPCILYMPDITGWWDLVDEFIKSVFLSMLESMDTNTSIFILSTAHVSYSEIPQPLQMYFNSSQGIITEMSNPTLEERQRFFHPLFMEKALHVSNDSSSIMDVNASGSTSDESLQSTRSTRTAVSGTGTRYSRRLRGLGALPMNSLEDGRRKSAADICIMPCSNKRYRPWTDESSKRRKTCNWSDGNQYNDIYAKMETASCITDGSDFANTECSDVESREKLIPKGDNKVEREKMMSNLLSRIAHITEGSAVRFLEILYNNFNLIIIKYPETEDQCGMIEEMKHIISKYEESCKFQRKNKSVTPGRCGTNSKSHL